MTDAEISLYARMASLEASRTSFVLVVLTEVVGGAPQDPGAKMLVTPAGLDCGTVGGGKVEAAALLTAGDMLKSGEGSPAMIHWNLRTDIGMTCGGSVSFYFELNSYAAWPIVIFGAGHVAQSLIRVLAPLPCDITCVDPREEWLAQLPTSPNLRLVQRDYSAFDASEISTAAFVVLMTKGHATDLPVLKSVLKQKTFPYIGVIGSKAKAAVLRKEVIDAGFSTEEAQEFHCPIGLPIGTNHPQEIAISIAAQLIEARDQRGKN